MVAVLDIIFYERHHLRRPTHS